MSKQQPQKLPLPTFSDLFEEGDPRFLRALYATHADHTFITFASKWYNDKRPFARQSLIQFIDNGCDRRGHRLLVKRLFKLAEASHDHTLMSHFLVAFDRLNQRKLVDTYEGKILVQTRHPDIKTAIHSYEQSRNSSRFTRNTRLYLQRRVWRYFRVLSSEHPSLYWEEIQKILLLYQDEHLKKPERLLDAWSLSHILYGASRVLHYKPRGATIRKGYNLAQLTPAPFCESAWEKNFSTFFGMLLESPSRVVRFFLRGYIAAHFAENLYNLPLASVRRLLTSPHEDLQRFGIERLKALAYLSKLTIQEWVSLIQIPNIELAPQLISIAKETLSEQPLSISECISLALAEIEPIANFGFSLCRNFSEVSEILRLPLGNAAVPEIRREAVNDLLADLSIAPEARSEHLRELLDSRFEDTRSAALSFMQNDARYRDSVVLWGALSESPYEDVRAYMVKHLKDRTQLFLPGTLHFVWASVLLAIANGSRTKQKVLQQLAEHLLTNPEETQEVLALLAIALRSVRAPERLGALAIIAKTAWNHPTLLPHMEKMLPELSLFGTAKEAP